MIGENLIRIADDDFWFIINDRFQTSGGIYKIIAVREGKRQTINRFLGTDLEGILYIGKAESFLDRVINLKKSISPKYNGTSHICGRRYKSNPNIAKQFPFENLYIQLTQSDSPETLEKSAIERYRLIFGEVPPLNAI